MVVALSERKDQSSRRITRSRSVSPTKGKYRPPSHLSTISFVVVVVVVASLANTNHGAERRAALPDGSIFGLAFAI